MGKASRSVYALRKLAEKLFQIRQSLNLTQEGMLKRFEDFPTLQQSVVSAYERGNREPPLLVLFAYAKAANVYVDVLLDDETNLSENLPCVKKSEGVR